MALEKGLTDLNQLEVSLVSGKSSLLNIQNQIFNTVLNNAPKFLHPSDVNHVDRVATSLRSQVELIIYTELEVDYIEKGVKVIQKAKESLTGLYNDYKPKY